MATRTRRRGGSRRFQRKFVWDRTFGSIAGPDTGADLLAPFRSQPGATHLGATIMRIRGYIIPSDAFGTVAGAGIAGIRVDTWNEDPAEPSNQPVLQPNADWMAYLPWNLSAVATTDRFTGSATWNDQASLWTVDVKSNRKLEELNQTLWLFGDQNGGGDRSYFYHLSIGMKLA